MNVTLDYLRGRRMWVVKNFVVWGEYFSASFLFLYSEMGVSNKRIIFQQANLGGAEQEVEFFSLYDIKGNQLPASINQPKVVVLQKSPNTCLVVGEETNSNFKVAKLNDTASWSKSTENGLVDLLIVEMG